MRKTGSKQGSKRTLANLHRHCMERSRCKGPGCRRQSGKTAGELRDTSKPQVKPPTIMQRRLEARIAGYDRKDEGCTKPGSENSNKPYPRRLGLRNRRKYRR